MYSYYYLFGLVLAGIIIYHFFFSKKGIVHGAIRRTKKKTIAEVVEGQDVRISGKIVYAGRTLMHL